MNFWPVTGMERVYHCSFHAKVEADLSDEHWKSLPLWKKMLKAAPAVFYLIVPSIAVTWLVLSWILGKILAALVVGLGVLILFRWLRASGEDNTHGTFAFTGQVEEWDLSPDDVELVDGRYVRKTELSL